MDCWQPWVCGDTVLTSVRPLLSQIDTADAGGSAKKFAQLSPGLRNQKPIFCSREGAVSLWHVRERSCFSRKIFLTVELLFVDSERDRTQQFPTCQSDIAVIEFRL